MTATTADGLHYVATAKDSVIMKSMYNTQRNWAETEMKLFQELAKQFYKVDDSNGWFLDLGANIGTTGIYFLKKLTPNLKLLAFEPDPENFKLLKTNLILNEIENAVVENCGLGFEESEMTMYRSAVNPGENTVFNEWFNQNQELSSEKIKVIFLDKYIDDNYISAKDIKYIWIDTQGSEAEILLGAKNLLHENAVPLFIEFNPRFWQISGYYEKMMKLLTELYKSYVWVKEVRDKGKVNVYPIEKLWEFQYSPLDGITLGDIFLIKKN